MWAASAICRAPHQTGRECPRSLRLERAYYHCASCGHGYCPRDKHLGIENTSLSSALKRMTGTVGTVVSGARISGAGSSQKHTETSAFHPFRIARV
jgi:hypothetical protein